MRCDGKAAEVLAGRNSVYGAAFEFPSHLCHRDRVCELSDELLMQQTNSVAKSRDQRPVKLIRSPLSSALVISGSYSDFDRSIRSRRNDMTVSKGH